MSHLYEEKANNKGCLMKIVEYNKASDITVEFQDKHKAKVKTIYGNFKSGSVRNPYCPTVCGVGITGNKYPSKINGIMTKEYDTWASMLQRCYDANIKENNQHMKTLLVAKNGYTILTFMSGYILKKILISG